MFNILFQAIRLAPRLVWQAYFQPSKAYDFINTSKENEYIFLWAFSFAGLIFGGILAIFHYYFYHDLIQSIFFTVASAFTGAFAGAFAFTFALVVSGAVSGAVSISVVVTEAVAVAVGFWLFSLLPSFALSIALFLAAICWFLVCLDGTSKIDLGGNEYLFILAGWLLMCMIWGGGIPLIKPYEILIFSIFFFINYCFISLSWFIDKNKKSKKNFEKQEPKKDDITHQKFGTVQKASFIWSPLLGLLLYLLVIFNIKPELHTKITIASVGFVIMPFFILHIPDYLLCLPLWFFQIRRASKSYKNTEKFLNCYENSILFKHEMLYFQLPGLHKFISLFAKNHELGIKEAVQRINHLYWFTFQQKQAQKAIIKLGKDKETAHQYIHFLLQEQNIPLIQTLSRAKNRLAELYLLLFDKIDETAHQKDSYRIPLSFEKGFFARILSREKQDDLPETFEEKINFVCLEMAKEESYRFNDEIIKTLESAYTFLTSKTLKDFHTAYSILNSIFVPSGTTENSPELRFRASLQEIRYLIDIQTLFFELKKIKDKLPQIQAAKQFGTRRDLMTRQKQALESLSKNVGQDFYEPFATIWKKALGHFAEVIQQEINVQHGSATLNIELKNREMLASEEERRLYFEICNIGQEYASDISLTIGADSPLLSFCTDTKTEFQIIESNTKKEFSLSILADTPVNTTIRGIIFFSDRTSDNKQVPFSFPLLIFKETVAFQKIDPNPYIIGNPLSGNSSLYHGREDAFRFIDENILVGDEHHTIVCHGFRRTGKTSLLQRIVNKGFTDKRLIPIYFDMQGIEDEKNFYKFLSLAIIETLSPNMTDMAESFGDFRIFLTKIKTELSERIVVLLIDEFEELQMRVEEGRMSKTIFSNIRHLMQHENKLIFLFCGTHKLEEMSADYWSIFFNTAMYLKISYLSTEDTRKLITEPVREQLTFDKLAVGQILNMTHGQPYLTQLICRTIVNDLNEKKHKNYAGIDDVDDATEQIVSGSGDHFSEHIWKESDILEHLILSAAAEEMTHKQLDFITLDAVFDKICSVTKDYPRKDCAERLDKLVSKDILIKDDLRYAFPVNLFRKWVFKRHPLRHVREML